MDAELLARIQFAFTISFHIVFPSFSIGLASYLAVLNGLWLKTGKEHYLRLFNHWKKIFAVAFGMGVVSGITMSYQFGTNWGAFSERAGPVIGPLMTYEVLTAFFLEAGFLGIMLFGRERVGNGLHMLSTVMVAIGTLISATWILSVNSWMQTPAGFSINEAGLFMPENWFEIVFNPSFPYRLAHMIAAAYLTTALVIGAASAYQMIRKRDTIASRTSFSMAMAMLICIAPIQIFIGDMHGLNTLEHQPAKIMAMEGHFDSHPDGAPLILFGIPDQEAKTIHYAIEIPKLSSLILKHDLNAPLDGLDTIADEDEPPVFIIFWTFRIMVGLGMAMLGLGAWAMLQRVRGKLYDTKMLQYASLAMGPAGFIAVLAGWVTTEVGRQPWTVYGYMRTSESLSAVSAETVAASLTAFVVSYFFIFGAGTYYLMRMMASGPDVHLPEHETGPIRSTGEAPVAEQVIPKSEE